MTDHLTPEQFEKYRRGRVSSRDLAEIDQHVAQCAKCREGLADFELAREFFSDLLGVERIEFAHPTYERFSAYVDGKSNEEDRRKIEGHLVLCGSCRDQLAVLQEFARQMNKQKGKSGITFDSRNDGSGKNRRSYRRLSERCLWDGRNWRRLRYLPAG
jgi:predicted anti-sigma-YlaC factor YlaD